MALLYVPCCLLGIVDLDGAGQITDPEHRKIESGSDNDGVGGGFPRSEGEGAERTRSSSAAHLCEV